MVTIKEIAEQLGVSPTTVSNVLNGRTGKMSAKTRQRVEEALASNHYVSESRSETVDAPLRLVSVNFCLGEKKQIMTDPFCASLMEALILEFRQYHLHVVSDNPIDEEELVRNLSARNIEGGIVLGYDPAKCEALKKRIARPVVFIDSGEGAYDNIGLEDAQGAAAMTAYLILQGHRRIAFFFDHDAGTYCNGERFRGFRQMMERHALEVKEEDCFMLPASKHQRHAVLRKFAKEKAGREYTAAFFVCDLYAHEAINLFYSQGLSVPEDISVAGFDDNIYARLARPALTTMRQHPEEKAREAAQMLVRRMRGEPVAANCVYLPAELIVRDSVRNVGKKEIT